MFTILYLRKIWKQRLTVGNYVKLTGTGTIDGILAIGAWIGLEKVIDKIKKTKTRKELERKIKEEKSFTF
jgi:hypothetical protein